MRWRDRCRKICAIGEKRFEGNMALQNLTASTCIMSFESAGSAISTISLSDMRTSPPYTSRRPTFGTRPTCPSRPCLNGITCVC